MPQGIPLWHIVKKDEDSMVEKFYDELEKAYQTGDNEEIERFLKESMSSSGSEGADDIRIVAFNELGKLYLNNGRLKEAVDSFQHAKTLVSETCGPRSLEYANIVNNLANACRVSGNMDIALREYEEALAVYRELGKTEGYFYSAALNNIAIIYIQKKRYEDAKNALQQALESTGQKEDLLPERAAALTNMGSLFMYEKKHQEALQCVKEAISIYDALPDEKKANMAAAYNTLGDLFVQEKQLEDAAAAYAAAKALMVQFCGKNLDYVTICRKLAMVYGRQKDYPKRDAKVKEALNIIEKLGLSGTKLYEDTKKIGEQ